MLVEVASAGQRKANEAGAIVLENRASTWMPTIEFARAAAEDLAQAGHRSVRMVDGYAKLPIDPHTRRVLGRARHFQNLEIVALVPLMGNDAEGLKLLVGETGNRLVAQCLADLGSAVQ